MPARAELDRRIERIDELIQRLEAGADPSVRATTQELVGTLMELHGAGLERILGLRPPEPRCRRSGAAHGRRRAGAESAAAARGAPG